MDEFPKALYRVPGHDVVTDSGPCAVRVVADADEQKAALADGWRLSSPEAHAPQTASEAPPTRAELEQKAAELGIKFDGRWGDKRLAEAIAKA